MKINILVAMSMNTKRRTYANPTVRSAKITDCSEAAELIYLTGEALNSKFGFKGLYRMQKEI